MARHEKLARDDFGPFGHLWRNPPQPFNKDVFINIKELDKELNEKMEELEESHPLWFGNPEEIREKRAKRRKEIRNEIYKRGIRYKDATEEQLRRYGYIQ